MAQWLAKTLCATGFDIRAVVALMGADEQEHFSLSEKAV